MSVIHKVSNQVHHLIDRHSQWLYVWVKIHHEHTVAMELCY